ncbi:hypothetical protein [Pararhizobium arenae]|uniref:hypothetical protein n=1 Tax=Pararhizobium arenae TaxID=1856850 RepID=UPI00094B2D00|nr:hypothetical protein [Pararhizobium arenae]
MEKDFSRISQRLDSMIQRHTAEMLATPILVCASRECRQRRRCRFVDRNAGNTPWCLRELDSEQLAVYGSLRDLAREWALWLYPGSFLRQGEEAAGLNAQAKAAVEIIAASLPRGDRLYPEARAWRRALYRRRAPKNGTPPKATQQTTEI